MMIFKYETLAEVHENDLIPIWSDKEVILDIFIVRHMSNIIGITGCPCINETLSQYHLFYQFKKSAYGKGYAT